MLLALTLSTLLHAAPAADSIAGSWRIMGSVEGNPVVEVCTIKQTGAALTGSCKSEGAAALAITGEVKDGAFTFRHAGEYEGQALTVAFSAPIPTATTFSGTIHVQPFDVGGQFTATRVRPNP
ncbi:MAG: hypothetical protein KY464_16580 [Gemmatimonadetes bacterium]|nr:hypothetical protein [Gemmatimonadota bacterium]